MARRNSTTTDTTTTTEEQTVNNTTDTTTVQAPAPAGLVFEAPPATATPKRVKGAKRQAVVDALKARPGEWARVKQNLKYTTETTEWRKLGCEVRAAKPEGSDLYSIWARWPLAEENAESAQ